MQQVIFSKRILLQWREECKPGLFLALNVDELGGTSQKHLLVSGIKDSSVVCSLHFSTPTSLLTGNDFSGFFKPIRDSEVKSFLSTFGWV